MGVKESNVIIELSSREDLWLYGSNVLSERKDFSYDHPGCPLHYTYAQDS